MLGDDRDRGRVKAEMTGQLSRRRLGAGGVQRRHVDEALCSSMRARGRQERCLIPLIKEIHTRVCWVELRQSTEYDKRNRREQNR